MMRVAFFFVCLLFASEGLAFAGGCYEHKTKLGCTIDPCCRIGGGETNWNCGVAKNGLFCSLKYPKIKKKTDASGPQRQPEPDKEVPAPEKEVVVPQLETPSRQENCEQPTSNIVEPKAPEVAKCVQAVVAVENHEFVKAVKEEHKHTGKCPKTFEDIEELKKLANDALAKGLDKNVDVSPLIGKISTSCIYTDLTQFNTEQWINSKASFVDNDHYYLSSDNSTSNLKCTLLERSKSEPGVWITQGADCNGYKSYRNVGPGQNAFGDYKLIPLGDGVYIQVSQQNKNGAEKQFAWGLLFAP